MVPHRGTYTSRYGFQERPGAGAREVGDTVLRTTRLHPPLSRVPRGPSVLNEGSVQSRMHAPQSASRAEQHREMITEGNCTL